MSTGLFVLGVTGNIASGKSTVTGMLAELGARVIDSDLVYRDLVAPRQPLLLRLTERFGDGIIGTDGGLDRAALGRIVFSDPLALTDLDRITHPAVIAEVDRRVHEIASGVVVLDAVKLIESGHDKSCDAVWVVVAVPETQVTRLTIRNNLTHEEARRRVVAQPPLAPKLERADLVIDNNGTIEGTREQVMRGWRALAHPHSQGVHRLFQAIEGTLPVANETQKIDVYFDYTCPWAWGGQVWLHQVKQELGDTLQINWRFFPLEQVNAKDPAFKLWEQPNDGTNSSLRSYQAAHAAKKQGNDAFDKFHAALFLKRHEDGRNLGKQDVLEATATEAGLDLETFRNDLQSDEVFATVKDDFTTGKGDLGVFGTPTIVFENGEGAYLKVNFRSLPKNPVTFWDEFVAIVRDRPEAIEIKRPQKG